MKRTFLIINFSLLILFASCDKINPNEYTTTTGGSGPSNWENFNVQRALVEKYTGPKCPNCPNADVALDAAHEQYGDRLIVISVNHPTGQGEPFNGQPDLRTDDGTAWDTYFGINAIPAAYINRDPSTLFSGSMGNISAAIGEVVNAMPLCNIGVDARRSSANEVGIDVDLELLSDIGGEMTLTLALVEDSLVYKQSLPGGGVQDDYVHNHMLRDVITNTWGDEIPMQGYAREHKVGHFTYTLPNADPQIKTENCHIVAFVSDKASRKVLNSAQCKIQ